MYIYRDLYLYMYTCIHIYVYMYVSMVVMIAQKNTHVHIHIYIYIYRYGERERGREIQYPISNMGTYPLGIPPFTSPLVPLWGGDRGGIPYGYFAN